MKTLEEAIQHCKDVIASCDDLYCRINYKQLKSWLTELKDYKDSKIFKLDKEEAEAAHEFYKTHKDCYKLSTIGGNFSYIITPTGLGNCVTIRCNSCRAEEDITNIENW